ncbi:MAG: superoxide dismutase [Alphaproteobacteria bacterium]|nr:superoxide dismutase [Alphaproteobacteria bacterium]
MFKLPPLKYELDALEPYISKKTMEFHYLKHHQGYINKLNELIEKTEYENMSLTDIIRKTANKPELSAIFNNAAQTFNHTFFWNSMCPQGGGKPHTNLMTDIKNSFGSYDNFKQEFKQAALSQFGSGWAWLIKKDEHTLAIMKTSNADTPIAHDLEPILTLDVWEHAYYLDYQNKRADFIDAYLEHLICWKE